MRFTTAIAASALVASVAAHKNETVAYTTETVTAYTTYCPEATKITHGSHTYTVTAATTLTITDCPCTLTRPVYSSAAPSAGIPAYTNGTAPMVSMTPVVAPTAASATKAASTPIATGGAGRTANVAGLAGLVGLAAFLF